MSVSDPDNLRPDPQLYTVVVEPIAGLLVISVFVFVFFCFKSKIKHVLLDFSILLNYVVGWQSRSFLTGLLQYLAKNMALLVQIFWGEFSICQNPFSAIRRLKKSSDGRATKKRTFFAVSLSNILSLI